MRDIKSAQKLKIAFSGSKYSDLNDDRSSANASSIRDPSIISNKSANVSIKKSNSTTSDYSASLRSNYMSSYVSQRYLSILESQKKRELEKAVQNDLQQRRKMSKFKTNNLDTTFNRKASQNNSEINMSNTYLSNQLSTDSQSSIEDASITEKRQGI
jgi:hypothetical protein